MKAGLRKLLTQRIWIPQAITTVMLLIALNPSNPYGYYILLRVICCAAYAYLTFHAIAHKQQGWAWALGVTAVVYNPIFRIHLTRQIWTVINLVTIAIGVASVFALKTDGQQSNGDSHTDTDQ